MVVAVVVVVVVVVVEEYQGTEVDVPSLGTEKVPLRLGFVVVVSSLVLVRSEGLQQHRGYRKEDWWLATFPHILVVHRALELPFQGTLETRG
jgi:hypothetical protein